jgi:hypothetical protein
MRLVLAAYLVGVLASCPLWCAADLGCRHEAEAAAPGESPVPEPVNDDHCICSGGLTASAEGRDLAAADSLRNSPGHGIALAFLAPAWPAWVIDQARSPGGGKQAGRISGWRGAQHRALRC